MPTTTATVALISTASAWYCLDCRDFAGADATPVDRDEVDEPCCGDCGARTRRCEECDEIL